MTLTADAGLDGVQVAEGSPGRLAELRPAVWTRMPARSRPERGRPVETGGAGTTTDRHGYALSPPPSRRNDQDVTGTGTNTNRSTVFLADDNVQMRDGKVVGEVTDLTARGAITAGIS